MVQETGDVEARDPLLKWLTRAALAYINAYPTSQANLRQVLCRKLETRGHDVAEHGALVDAVVGRLVALQLVDDAAFAESRLNALGRRGVSTVVARAKLLQKGVADDTIDAAMQDGGFDEAAAARAYARRRGLGPFRRQDREERRDRDLAAMARAGFPYGLAKATIDAGSEDDPAGP